jgi:uncharacterized glyoxalase superfamily protein PhnB
VPVKHRPDRVRGLCPFVHVSDIRRSIAFYELLGFEIRETHKPRGKTVWAYLEAGEGRIMLAEASDTIEAHAQAVLFYLYSDDLAGLRKHLLASGVTVGDILDGAPGPKEEMRLSDPDGYCLMVAQIEEGWR